MPAPAHSGSLFVSLVRTATCPDKRSPLLEWSGCAQAISPGRRGETEDCEVTANGKQHGAPTREVYLTEADWTIA